MKSKTILGADGATKMRQITVGIHGKGNSGKGSREKGRGRLRNTAPRKHNVFVLFLPEIQGLQCKNGNVPEMRPVHKQGRG